MAKGSPEELVRNTSGTEKTNSIPSTAPEVVEKSMHVLDDFGDANNVPDPMAEMTRLEFAYFPDKFESRDAYLSFLAQKLNTPDEMNRFLKYCFVYDASYEKGKNQQFMNSSGMANDVWRSPQDIATQYREDGKFWGDCDDIATLFEDIIARQGKHPVFFVVPRHAFTGWIENENGRAVAYCIDTTRLNNAEGEASCKKLVGNPGESEQAVFARLADSVLKSSDSGSAFDPDHFNVGFMLADNRAVILPADFDLAMRYQELKKMFEAHDIPAVEALLKAEMERNPNNTNLRIAYIQILVMQGLPQEEIQKCIEEIHFHESMARQVQENMNQTAYFLREKGYVRQAVALFEKAVIAMNAKRYEINFSDTLSDLYVAAQDYEKALENDIRLFEEIKKFDEIASKKEMTPEEKEIFFYYGGQGFMNAAPFFNMLRERISRNEDYRRYVEERRDLPKGFPILQVKNES